MNPTGYVKLRSGTWHWYAATISDVGEPETVAGVLFWRHDSPESTMSRIAQHISESTVDPEELVIAYAQQPHTRSVQDEDGTVWQATTSPGSRRAVVRAPGCQPRVIEVPALGLGDLTDEELVETIRGRRLPLKQ